MSNVITLAGWFVKREHGAKRVDCVTIRRVNIQRQSLTGMLRLLVTAVVSLLLAGCGSLVTIVTATPNETQQAASVVTSAPTDVPAQTSAVTSTRRPRNTATSVSADSTSTPTLKAVKATAKPSRIPTRTPTAIPSTLDGLQTVRPADLPDEAQQTLALIDSDRPFLYARDGIVFQNREGILPKKSSTYYHEYTVVTPGSPDRGAKRLIAGSKGEIYYTEDHYVTFVRVIR